MRDSPRSVKARDLAPTGVRLQPELRDFLMREATLNGRSLSKQIELILDDWASAKKRGRGASYTGQLVVSELLPSLDGKQKAVTLSDSQRLLLALFDGLPPERQLALLTFLRA